MVGVVVAVNAEIWGGKELVVKLVLSVCVQAGHSAVNGGSIGHDIRLRNAVADGENFRLSACGKSG